MIPYGWIYFFQNGKPDRVKIGFTTHSNNTIRKRQLQTGSDEQLNPWSEQAPIAAFKSQESELHALLAKFHVPNAPPEWFFISSEEARSIIAAFCESIKRSDVPEDGLPLFTWAVDGLDPYKKYELSARWPIEQVADAEFPWLVRMPNGRGLLCKSVEQAKRQRLLLQYFAKFGQKTGGAISCWLPDDVA